MRAPGEITATASAAAASSNASLATSLSRPRIAGLDFLRAVAVLLVLASHSNVPLADGGFGVLMFFVLSGFLITRILLEEIEATGDIQLGPFYRRRAARLLPAFYAYLLVGLIPLLLLDRPVPWEAVAASALYVVNYYQAFTGAPTHYLSHCWSLAVEEQFYLLWPLLLLFVKRRGANMAALLLGLMVSVWILRPLLIFAFGANEQYLYRALETRADQLAMGCLLAVVLRSHRWQEVFEHWARSRAWIGVVTATLISMVLLEETLFLKFVLGFALKPLLVAGLIPLVIIAASGSGIGARLLNAKPMVQIGQASYGIYLFHPYVMHPTRNILQRLSVPEPAAIVLSFLAVVLLASASFRYFENPLRQRYRGH